MAKKYIILNCNECKNNFKKRTRTHNESLKKTKTNTFYCSRACLDKHHSNSQKFKCKTCEKEVKKSSSVIRRNKTGNFFCNQKCSSAHNNKGVIRNPKKTRVCNRCDKEYQTISSGEDIHTSKLICRECASINIDYKSMAKGEYEKTLSETAKKNASLNTHIRAFNNSWNKDLKSLPCQKCSYHKHVELAHIKAVRLFTKNDLLSDINSSDNLLALCPNCHWEFDNGHLKLEDIPKRI